MYHSWIIVTILGGSFSAALTKYSCVMKNLTIDCTLMEQQDLLEDMEVTISSENVLDLTVRDSRIPLVDRAMFGKYHHLHTLRLQNVQAENIEEDAFTELFSLRNLYLKDNSLSNFSSNVLPTNLALHQLDLSNNILQDLSDFNVSSYPVLSILNISYNMLEYLPRSLVDKLEEENNFYLIIDNNPWDCTHPKWADIMTSALTNTFCTGNKYDASLRHNAMRLKKWNSTEEALSHDVGAEHCKNGSWCFSYCIFWFVGAIWIGIILGNVCKLKELICTSNSKNHDKNTQYDKMDVRQRI